MRVTWVLAQTGNTISGVATTTGLDPDDGSCSSCHRAKGGTISGTVSATGALDLTMSFPGQAGEATPACATTFTGTAATVANNELTISYTGVDTCESLTPDGVAFENGQLTITRTKKVRGQTISAD